MLYGLVCFQASMHQVPTRTKNKYIIEIKIKQLNIRLSDSDSVLLSVKLVFWFISCHKNVRLLTLLDAVKFQYVDGEILNKNALLSQGNCVEFHGYFRTIFPIKRQQGLDQSSKNDGIQKIKIGLCFEYYTYVCLDQALPSTIASNLILFEYLCHIEQPFHVFFPQQRTKYIHSIVKYVINKIQINLSIKFPYNKFF